jgi:hypothetical protein
MMENSTSDSNGPNISIIQTNQGDLKWISSGSMTPIPFASEIQSVGFYVLCGIYLVPR